MLFVTGSNAAFFNSLFICLQSFKERLPDQTLLVCDYGMTEPQTQFLRNLGILLERPPSVPAQTDVFICKAALLRYLQHSRIDLSKQDAIIWLDGDLTLMNVGTADFARVVQAMQADDIPVAICRDLDGKTIKQMVDHFNDPALVAPFTQCLQDHGVALSSPYFSTGLFFCRSLDLLQAWDTLTGSVAYHPLFEQNMFNIVLHHHRLHILALDCEEWQAQGFVLDRIRLRPDEQGRSQALIGGKNIKTLHSTSPHEAHLLIVKATMTVRDIEISGIYKLLFAEDLRMVQLNLLSTFIHTHAALLLHLGLCRKNPVAIDGFHFSG